MSSDCSLFLCRRLSTAAAWSCVSSRSARESAGSRKAPCILSQARLLLYATPLATLQARNERRIACRGNSRRSRRRPGSHASFRPIRRRLVTIAWMWVGRVAEIIELLLFRPFISLFHASAVVWLTPRNQRERILQLLTGGSLFVALASLATVVVLMWQHSSLAMTVTAFATCVAAAYAAGLFAWILEKSSRCSRIDAENQP
jgi:hypothetical protein